MCLFFNFKQEDGPRLFALYSDAPQVGKTTVAKTLANTRQFEIVSFAAPIKRMVATFLTDLGIDPETADAAINGDLKEERIFDDYPGLTTRYLMQTLGTEWGRDMISEYVWTWTARHRIDTLLKQGRDVVVDDLRFPDEYAMLAAMGAKFIKIERPGYEPADGHRSTGALRHHTFHLTLRNDGSLADLQRAAQNL